MEYPIKVYPAEGYGAHRKTVEHMASILNRSSGFRALWSDEESELPTTQLCTTNNVPQPIAFSEITLANPLFSADLPNGIFTLTDDVQSFDLYLAFQVIRQVAGGGTAKWAFCLQTFAEGVGWVNVPNSTRQYDFLNPDNNKVRTISFSSTAGPSLAGTQLRLVQVCDDVSKNIGIISDKPFTALARSPGVNIGISINY